VRRSRGHTLLPVFRFPSLGVLRRLELPMMAMMTSPSRLRLLGITVAVVLLCLMPLTAPIVTRSQG
jgi:hypothetical protein